MSENITIAPTWTGVLRIYLTAYAEGGFEGRRAAEQELQQMAALADKYVELMKDKSK